VPGEEVLLAESERPGQAPEEEEVLAADVRAGSASAFERLYELHGARMKSIAANLLGNLADAEDAVQDSFVKIYRGAASFRGGSRFSTWAYRVLVNSCYDMLRKRRRWPEPAEGAATSRLTAPATDHPLRLSLEACLEDLHPKRRAVFLLFEVEGLTHREVGDILGLPEATSRTLLFEAKRDLQRSLWKRGAVGVAGAGP
jgi:RNA polymerase sigma-70 factor (ECF subfamily)